MTIPELEKFEVVVNQPDSQEESPVESKSWFQRSRVLRRLLADRIAMAALAVITFLIAVAVCADWLAPQDPNKASIADRLKPPSSAHWLGTDELGRDVLSRLIVATRLDLLASFEAVGIALAIGVPLGLLAGYFGGVGDAVTSRVIDALMTLPPLILAVVIIGILGPGLTTAMLAIGILIIPSIYRVVRASTQSTRSELYIESARAAGCGHGRIIFRHVLPAVSAPLLVQASFAASAAIVAEASLSYLGLGARAPQATWGLMLKEAASSLATSSYLLFPPAIMISVTILALSLLGDGLRDAMGRQNKEGGK